MTSATRNRSAIAAAALLTAGAYVAITEARGGRPLQQRPEGPGRSLPREPGRATGELEVLQLRPNFFMIAGAGAHISVQIGDDGVVVVDGGSAARADAVVAAIKRLTPRPIRYVIDTSADPDHVGGNETLSKAGQTLFTNAGSIGITGNFLGGVASILSHENVLSRVSAPTGKAASFPVGVWPTETFDEARKYMYLNGEGIEVLHQPAAHTDGDVVVFFRRSDVVVAGDILDTRRFPVIDVARGGTINGEIAALNKLVELAIPSVPIVSREAGTLVVPGHGRVCDQFDVVEYRDMVTIIRDRVRDSIKAGHDAGADQGRVSGQRLHAALRRGFRSMDHDPLHRGGVSELSMKEKA